ncbi:MAG: serine/threonine protein kinase [Myxococcales bacterium]|nr:serine/threonine protein kinase [Myxococcales bacterium]
MKRVGQVLSNKFTLDALLDIGGMAAVYAATHRNGKKVAVKMLHPQYASNEEVKERFLREGYVANKVDHRGSVQILDDDVTADGAPFLVMELLSGESLDKWMYSAGGRLTPGDVLALADQVLDVLDAFHAHGIVHRDIKPANLFVTRAGVIKVLDFGLARVRDARMRATPTASGTIIGTSSYMSPEQAQGKNDAVDPRTDVFAVGAVMFHALTGEIVHKGRSAMERLMSAMQTPAPKVRTLAPHVPLYVGEIIDKALEFHKEDRWPSAAMMRERVRDAYVQLKAARVASMPPPPRPADAATVRPPPEVLAQPARPAAAEPPPAPEPAPPSSAIDPVFEPSIVVEVSFGGTPLAPPAQGEPKKP